MKYTNSGQKHPRNNFVLVPRTFLCMVLLSRGQDDTEEWTYISLMQMGGEDAVNLWNKNIFMPISTHHCGSPSPLFTDVYSCPTLSTFPRHVVHLPSKNMHNVVSSIFSKIILMIYLCDLHRFQNNYLYRFLYIISISFSHTSVLALLLKNKRYGRAT